MALSTAELQRIKYELGYNVLTEGADPYIGTAAIFETVVAQYLPAGASTTSSTAVTASATPTVRTLVLASATGFAAGARIWVGVDDNLETATIQSISGTSATVSLMKAHSGTYPVYVDGGEGIVRELLTKIKEAKTELSSVSGAGGLKRVDEIEWYQAGTKSELQLLGDKLMFWRDELASLLGVSNMWRNKRAAGTTLSVY